MSKSYLVTLPLWGQPFVLGEFDDNADDALERLQAVVRGSIEMPDHSFVKILPSACASSPRWDMARMMLAYKHTQMYINEEGKYNCSPNMCTVHTKERMPIFGNIALVVPQVFFTTLGLNPDELKEVVIGEDDE
jgi:hypothetical protein